MDSEVVTYDVLLALELKEGAIDDMVGKTILLVDNDDEVVLEQLVLFAVGR